MATTYEQPRPRAGSTDTVNRWLTRAYAINWEVVAYAIIFVLAVFTRFYNLGDRVMSHDESLHVRYSYNLYNEGNFQHTPLMHGPILFHMTALNFFLFGDNDFTGRIYAAALGTLVVMIPLLFRRWLGRTGALLASIMLLISPLMLYYNRYIRHDTPNIFFALIMVYCVFMYVNGPLHLRRRARWLYIFSGAMLGALGSKETAFIYIAIFGSFLTLYWVVRLVQHFRGVPGRTAMYFASLGVIIGGVVALGFYIILEIIPPTTVAASASGGVETTSFVSWSLLVITAALVGIIGTAIWAFRGSPARLRLSDIVILLLLAVIVCGFFVYAEEASRLEAPNSEATAEAVEPGEEAGIITSVSSNLPIIVTWVLAAVVIAAVLFAYRRGWVRVLYRFPEFDILIVMGTLILPWMTAIPVWLSKASPTDYSSAGILRSVSALIPLMAISIVVGLVWNWKRWLICAAIFHVLFAFFFTTMFTNVQGLASGMVGSLGYWIEQQGVRRGNQPQYYYLLIILPFYEFLPVIGSVLAGLAGLTYFWRYRRNQLEQSVDTGALIEAESSTPIGLAAPAGADGDELPSLNRIVGDDVERRIAAARAAAPVDEKLRRVPFLLFVSWWAVLNLIAYTLAGEKMPWLGTHMTLPMIFLTAWYFGRVIERVEWAVFVRRGWLFLLLFPLLLIAGFQLVEPFLIGQSPFAGLQQQQLAQLYEWLGILLFCGLVIYFIYEVGRRTSWQHMRRMIGVSVFALLAVLTFRSAWMASFINYDLANEFLVYAHAAPAVKTVLHDIEDISRRVTGGMDLKFAYDNETSWPNSWYYRSFPNAVFVGGNPTPQSLQDTVAVVVGEANRSKVEPILEDRYFHFEYIRMWWPMQDYFNLSASRVANLFDFSGANPQAAQIRQGLWDIWWARDYSTYSEAVGGNWTLKDWPVSDRMHFYVRKDVASQIWNLGAGEGSAVALEDTQPNMCVQNWQPRTADLVFSTRTGNPVPMNHPLDVAVANGRVYIADEFNNRVAVYDTEGNYLMSIGGPIEAGAPPVLNRPNGVAIGPDGRLYVADTWNYRVQVFTLEGEPLHSWGQVGQFGFEAGQSPEDAFWGPRDILVDAQGRVYVSDTGNKRIRVYTSEGQWIRDIGSGGSGDGQLDEPSGLALHPDGRLFVADTWNRRISVFSTEGQHLYNFAVRGWYDDQGNRPYLALDTAQNILYVTDPEAGRVLVFDTYGNCLGSFGQAGEDLPEASQLNVATGIVTDEQNNVYVTDARAGRVLKFAPYPLPQPVAPQAQDMGEVSAETTPETMSEELMSETTSEAFSEETTQDAGFEELESGTLTEEATPEATLELRG